MINFNDDNDENTEIKTNWNWRSINQTEKPNQQLEIQFNLNWKTNWLGECVDTKSN